MKLNLGSGSRCLEGFENLDVRWGWKFESRLPYIGGSVRGITISHALMYLPEGEWPHVFEDFFRVLAPGGVVRITEDDTESETSKRAMYPHPAAVVRTGPRMAAQYLKRAGFVVHHVDRNQTHFADRSLIQAWRDEVPPYYFFVEGVKLEPQFLPDDLTQMKGLSPDVSVGWMRARRGKIAVLRTLFLCARAIGRQMNLGSGRT